jgi:hypothetical protein
MDGWLNGRTKPVYGSEYEVVAAGRAKHLKLDPDY